ncbi:tetratricopeptide repeat protein [Uliginosibacterium sp. 31-16]|uniref:nuclear transport factor 2 family protein n=1 Tax=Uliginosibacterium sp. 31-16 TaxID=3068315 RepID=UPI00273E1006|nr:tetratricopeptide repeat protein [Uliginosibacterium sp. 31-16]MDP5239784.1 tetratricopeptide repeat protein [Uliginosibacterium sp. 31-16]
MRRSNSPCFRICVAALLALSTSILATTAQAQSPNPLAEAQTLLQQGQQSQALDKVERALAANPKDRQARFLKGVILAEMNKLDDAAAVFVKLTEEAPELPEPYNNLAVIYAQQKQFDKAKAALEMAIRTHPSYAVAHENLGDLYAKMARQAYDRALQIDSKNTNAQAKLNLLRDLTTASTPPAASKPVIVAAATPATKAPAPALNPQPASQPPAANAPVAKPPVTVVATAPVTPVTPAAAQPASKPATTTAAPAEDDKKAIRTAIQAWAAAWSNKNAKEYLSYYAKDFQVPDKKARKAWEEERTQRVTKPGEIKVSLSDIDIAVKGSEATVRFKQHYDSSTFNSASGKTLAMVQRNGRWQIQQERIGR